MAITKTRFINYIRCPRYAALDDIRNKLLDDVSLEEYKEEEKREILNDIISSMEDDSNNILVDDNPKLEALLPYYNEVEHLAALYVEKHFEGKLTYCSTKTYYQKKFNFVRNDINYLIPIFIRIINTLSIYSFTIINIITV